MIVKRLFLFLIVIAACTLAIRAGSGYTVVVQTDGTVSINNIAASLSGTVVDSMDGGLYLVAIPSWPSTVPAGVISIQSNDAASLPRFSGAVIKTSAVPDWYKNQPTLKLINLASGLT